MNIVNKAILVGGTVLVVGSAAIAYLTYNHAEPVLDWASMDVKGVQCGLQEDASTKDCQSLREYGIQPQLYLSNDLYRRAVNAYQLKAVKTGSGTELLPLEDYLKEYVSPEDERIDADVLKLLYPDG